MEKKQGFKPFIPADRLLPEFTPAAIVLGVVLAVVFGAANAYLGLRVGQTVSASIPAAVLSMGILRGILKRDSILENNLVQTIGSSGEAVAAGAIFVLPAFFLWFSEWGWGTPGYLMLTLLTLAGGILGVVFMVPLRRSLIVAEHETLPYPEGTACAEVLQAGETGGAKAKTTFLGVGMGAAFKFVADGLKLFPSSLSWHLPSFKGTAFGVDILPALTGVGYIIGPRISSYMFAGGCLGWLCIMPLIAYFGSFAPEAVYPGALPIADMAAGQLWGSYLRYVGAGAVAFGGLYSLVTNLPSILRSFGSSVKALGGGKTGAETAAVPRTDKDLPTRVLGIIVAAVLVVLVAVPAVPIGLPGALLILLFGFFFSTVSSRIVGIVGSSSSPVSGMTVATLLITTLLYIAVGQRGREAMVAVMSIACVICIIAAIAGDTSQDLKTGYLLGATPRLQQVGELIGVAAIAPAMGGILILLDTAWGFGSEELPAVQATLMKTIVEGTMGGDLPWVLVLAGAAIGLTLAVLGLPVLAVGVGIYLPFSLTTAVMAGGLLRLVTEKLLQRKKDASASEKIEGGVLYASGLIAGEGLMGILLAVFTVLGLPLALGEGPLLGQAVGVLAFGLLGFSLLKSSLWRKVTG